MPEDTITFGATNPDYRPEADPAAQAYEGQTITRASYAERLAAVNASVKFTNIKGKEYAEVNQRVLAFWSLFPDGRIETEKVSDDGTRCDFKAMAYRHDTDERPAATGHAYEVKGRGVNSTSYVENCETSAIGRALGFLGIGATAAIASADEVLQAIAQQEAQAAGGIAKEPPAQGPFSARCKSCGHVHQFGDRANYEQWLAYWEQGGDQNRCCPNISLEVM